NSGGSSSAFPHLEEARSAVSKDGQQARCSCPPFETRSYGPLLRVRWLCALLLSEAVELDDLGGRSFRLGLALGRFGRRFRLGLGRRRQRGPLVGRGQGRRARRRGLVGRHRLVLAVELQAEAHRRIDESRERGVRHLYAL